MIDIFGNKWTKRMGSVDDGEGYLAEAALSWQSGLAGYTINDLKTAFTALDANTPEWPPELREFKALCRGIDTQDIPRLDKVISVLATASRKTGSIAYRYEHPLILAISHEVDMYQLRMARYNEARMIVKPVYEQFIAIGWPPFPEHAHDNPLALAHDPKPKNKAVAKSYLDAMKQIVHQDNQPETN